VSRRPTLALLAVAGALLLAGCASHKAKRGNAGGAVAERGQAGPADDTRKAQSERYRQNQDNGPAAPPIDVSKIAEPVPKVEPRSRYGNKPTYSVLGRSYHVLPSAKGYVGRGTASWYGSKFHGYMTSSFEPYDMYQFSAAHKTLPLPSYARVTNLDNGKSVVVRVNDRGPFHDGRVIDLSYAAAVKIGVWPKGTGRVEVRAIDPTQPDSRTAMAARPSPQALPDCGGDEDPRCAAEATAGGANASQPPARIYLQLGAFGERRNAERAVADAQRAGIDQVGIESVAVSGRTVHRVRVGPLADAAAADALTARIEQLGLGAPRVAIER
jgi:rare lipoprotein A